MAIRIDFLANVSNLLRGTGDVDQALDKVSSSLDDVVRDAETGTNRISGSFRDLAADTKRVDIGGDVGRSFKRGTQEADEGVRTLKENTRSNLKEVAASFDGTAQGAADGFQGLAAEIAEGFGPAGLIAGALVAGGIGIISTQLQDADANNKVLQEHIAQLGAQLIETGHDGQQGLGTIVSELKALATQTDPAQASLLKLQSIAKRAGESYTDLARAYSGNGEGLEDLIREEQSHSNALESQANSIRTVIRGTTERMSVEGEAAAASGAYTSALKDAKKAVDGAAAAEQAYIKAGGPELQAKADATQEYADSVQSALADAGADWEKYKTKQGVNLDKYNDNLEKSIKATENYQENVKKATKTLSQEALNYIESLGEDAAPLLQEYIDAPNKMKNRTAANWERLGKASGSAYNAELQSAIPDSIKGPAITIDAEASAAAAIQKMDAYFRNRPLSILVDAHTRNGQRVG